MTQHAYTQREADLVAGLRPACRIPARAATVIVLGPPGVGKTTLVTSLAAKPSLQPTLTHIERPEINPYLMGYGLPGARKAAKSQEWFLDQYLSTINCYRDEKTVLLDQDPRGVALVYANCFFYEGWIQRKDYYLHLARCREVLENLSNLTSKLCYVLLSTSTAVLEDRVRQRPGMSSAMLRLLPELHTRFDVLYGALTAAYPDQCVEYDTGAIPADVITEYIEYRLRRLR